MSIKNEKNFEEQEIDLSIISKRVSSFIKSINYNVFRVIQFIRKNIVVFGILVVGGAAVGYYLDDTQKTYKNSIVVQPNFESTDYLYSKIEFLNTKIKDNDTLFLKSIGIQNPMKLMNIEVSPIIDIYKFIDNTSSKEKEGNFQLLKLMAEDGDIKKIIKEDITSKNYAFHKIVFNTKAKNNRKEIVNPVLEYLETNSHYLTIQKIYLENLKKRIIENKIIIGQIDDLLASFKNKNGEASGKDKMFFYNENMEVNEVIKTKSNLISYNANMRLDMQSLNKIMKEQSTILNVHNTKSVNGKLKLLLPVVFVLLYLFIFSFVRFYKKQASLYTESK